MKPSFIHLYPSVYNKLCGFHRAGGNPGGWRGLNGQAVSCGHGVIKIVNRSQCAKPSSKGVSQSHLPVAQDQICHTQGSSQLGVGNACGVSPGGWRAGFWLVVKTGRGNDVQRSRRYEATGDRYRSTMKSNRQI